MPVLIAIRRAEIQSVLGKTEEAYATLRAAQELHTRRPSGIWTERDLLAHEADIYLRNGDILAAEQLLNQGGRAGTHTLSDIVYAEIALIRSQFAAAERLLTRVINEHPNGLLNDHLMDARVLLPLALFGQHKINLARRTMTETIRRAAPEKFCQPFLKRSLECLPLLVLVLHTENLTADAKEFIDEILRTTEQYSEVQCSLPEEYTDLVTAASITSREQEILDLLATGLTNREMALHLGISESTVKTHLVNIYTKLDVNSRVQALSQAQALNLI
jgi:LuxR family maltose regulon positive regulatory protein